MYFDMIYMPKCPKQQEEALFLSLNPTTKPNTPHTQKKKNNNNNEEEENTHTVVTRILS